MTMENYFSSYTIRNLKKDVEVDGVDYKVYCMILTVLSIAAYYLILVLLPYRDESFFYPLAFGVVCLYGIQVYLQFMFTKLLIKKETFLPIEKKEMLTIRKELNYKWYEFVLPVLLINYTSPLIIVSVFSLAVIFRLAYTFRQLG